MPDNFKQVVNLQSKAEEDIEPAPKRKAILGPVAKARPIAKRKVVAKKQIKEQSIRNPRQSARGGPAKMESRVEDIDHVYSDEDFVPELKEELLQIDRPKIRDRQSNFFKQVSVALVVIIAFMLGYYFLFDNKDTKQESGHVLGVIETGEWYSVQLANKETYYGFIKDVSADPVILEKVYYNYNQVSGVEVSKEEEDKAANIRLVKRGKESHGPDGTMNIVRSQLMYMEVLRDESKILQAILKYEE